MSIEALRWRDGRLHILDQRKLPCEEVWIEAQSWQEVADAITSMAVRGAPLIGIAAAYGLALAQQSSEVNEAKAGLAATRPTAVNLFHCLDRTARAADMLGEARLIEAEERAANDAIANHGADLIAERAKAITICNTGSLATAGVGTALGILRKAYEHGKIEEVFACETRPRLQGLRLTAWELQKDGIPFRVIPDSAAASLMRGGDIGFAVSGADRIAANGDTANKIGTYSLAISCKEHGVPFFVAAPTSTIDPATATGQDIPIEERDGSEVTEVEGARLAPQGCPVWNPAFDVTPARLISAIVTERGAHRPPYGF